MEAQTKKQKRRERAALLRNVLYLQPFKALLLVLIGILVFAISA